MRSILNYIRVLLIALLNNWNIANAQIEISPLFPCSEMMDDPYGITSHLARENRDYPYIDQLIDKINFSGINNIRTDFLIDFTNNNLDEKELQRYREVVEKSYKANISPLAILAPGVGNKYAWDDIRNYSRYVDQMLNNYGHTVRYWEVLNEVNKTKASTKDYYELLKKTYTQIKATNKESVVISSGFAGLNDDYVEGLCKLGFHRYIDKFNFHNYSDPEGLVQSFIKLKTLMDKYDWKKPVWLTECGMPTQIDTVTSNLFYTDFLPRALKILKKRPKRQVVGILQDRTMKYTTISEPFVQNHLKRPFKKTVYIDIQDLGHLDVNDVPVLIATSGESFPTRYIDDLLSYVKNGGTIVLSCGAPFYFSVDLDSDANELVSIGSKYYASFHMGAYFHWTEEAKKIGAVRNPDYIWTNDKYNIKYKWPLNSSYQTIYMNTNNLKNGDELITLVEAGSKSYRGCVAGIYKLNSDLKGNIIFQTREGVTLSTDKEYEQACRLPRVFLTSFAYGIDKVFWYNLRSLEQDIYHPEHNYGILHKDLSEKMAFRSMKALTSICPPGSSRPKMTIKYNYYLCSWEKPDGTKIWAIWCPSGNRDNVVDIDGDATYYNMYGDRISGMPAINPGVTYIVGANKVTFN